MKLFNNLVHQIKHIFGADETHEHVSKSEETKRLIQKTISEKDRHLFEHFCDADLRKFLDLIEGHELKDQTVEDLLDHMDRALTKGPVSVQEQRFCADVVLKMFHATDDRSRLFDRIEAHIGSEHFIQDLVRHNADLEQVVNNLK